MALVVKNIIDFFYKIEEYKGTGESVIEQMCDVCKNSFVFFLFISNIFRRPSAGLPPIYISAQHFNCHRQLLVFRAEFWQKIHEKSQTIQYWSIIVVLQFPASCAEFLAVRICKSIENIGWAANWHDTECFAYHIRRSIGSKLNTGQLHATRISNRWFIQWSAVTVQFSVCTLYSISLEFIDEKVTRENLKSELNGNDMLIRWCCYTKRNS